MWKEWSSELKPVLVKSLNGKGTGCREGSWEPVDRWSAWGGRVYATAINWMSLMIYYRYANVFGTK